MSPAVASSSTLWAQGMLMSALLLPQSEHPSIIASKEWVIPAKPKPGRKPKKDPPAPPVEDSTEVRVLLVSSYPLETR